MNSVNLVPSPYSVQGSDPPEPVLEDHDIQGNGIAGFSKDYQAFLYFVITDVSQARRCLRDLVPYLATVRDVWTFNRRFRTSRANDSADPPGLVATWTNIAFSCSGLEVLAGNEVQAFSDSGFRQGLAARSALIGDSAGSAENWVVGGSGDEPHGVLIVASDDTDLLGERIRRIQRLLRGVRVIFNDRGEVRQDRRGHEHFGFRDGISQPAVRGRLASSPGEYLSPRYLMPNDPARQYFASPGRALIWPGQFLLGHDAQDGDDPLRAVPNQNVGPPWARNGSFLVVRRLQQDVVGFWDFLRREGAANHVPPEQVGALLMGRWPSGCPLSLSPLVDDAELGNTHFANNYFAYAQALPATVVNGLTPPAQTMLAPAPADRTGERCPFAAHIRKMNPRDVGIRGTAPSHNARREMLRRGIPYGPPVRNPFFPTERDLAQKRGLIFAAYMSSIVSQFEFVMHGWAHSPLLPENGGRDPILSRGTIKVPALRAGEIRAPDINTWVTPTGGGYFFAPSLTAIRTTLSR